MSKPIQTQVIIVYYIESNGNRYIETITDDPVKWLKHHNMSREEDESLDDFELVLKSYQKFN